MSFLQPLQSVIITPAHIRLLTFCACATTISTTVEVHLGTFVFLNNDWKECIPEDPTGAIDEDHKERNQATAGYLGGAFDVESLVENLLGQLAGNQEIVVNVYDITNVSGPLVMYGSQNKVGDLSLEHVSKLDFGDPFRNHEMICRYLLRAATSWLAFIVALFSFVIATLVGYIYYGSAFYIIKVRDDFHKMQKLKVKV